MYLSHLLLTFVDSDQHRIGWIKMGTLTFHPNGSLMRLTDLASAKWQLSIGGIEIRPMLVTKKFKLQLEQLDSILVTENAKRSQRL